MATILYLDVDDEITTAATRIRGAADKAVAIVLPSGSRLATSRINFRLLAREGLERNRVLSIVAADPAARAIAASAGLPVYASVAEFEAAGVPGAVPSDSSPDAAKTTRRRRAAKGAAAGAAELGGSAATLGWTADRSAAEQMSADLLTGGGPDAPTVVAPPPRLEPPARRALPPAETRPRSSAATASDVPNAWSGGRLSGRLFAVLGSLVVVVLILAVVGYVVLPRATVVVTPIAAPIGPVSFVVRADPDATSVDAVGGVIPATRLSLDFTASGEFEATGKRVVQAKAKGSLRWRNCDPTRSYTIPAGSVASTGSGIGFETDAAVFLPVAIPSPDGTRITCQARVVAARAVKTGPGGNVGAGSVTVVSSDLNSVVIKVSNPAAMTGGKRNEFTRVQQADVDAALAQLTKDIGAQFSSWAAAPDELPQGATAFPATGKLGTLVPSADPSTLIDVEEPTFQLGATATGTVVAVDVSQIDPVARERIAAQVPAERTLRDGSVTVQPDAGSADGELVDFRVTAAGQAIAVLDPTALREAIKGKSVDEARTILGRYGTVSIDTWPGFVSSIPTIDARLDLTVAGDAGASSPAPSGGAP
jgi:hypothetical protein